MSETLSKLSCHNLSISFVVVSIPNVVTLLYVVPGYRIVSFTGTPTDVPSLAHAMTSLLSCFNTFLFMMENFAVLYIIYLLLMSSEASVNKLAFPCIFIDYYFYFKVLWVKGKLVLTRQRLSMLRLNSRTSTATPHDYLQ